MSENGKLEILEVPVYIVGKKKVLRANFMEPLKNQSCQQLYTCCI